MRNRKVHWFPRFPYNNSFFTELFINFSILRFLLLSLMAFNQCELFVSEYSLGNDIRLLLLNGRNSNYKFLLFYLK